jgi:GNAT superfamily N-acetyltransferase
MSEISKVNNEIKIEILGNEESHFGSKVEQKRKPLDAQIETVTVDNYSQYFPETTLTSEKKKELEQGVLYIKVAVNPENGARAGFVEVRHQHDNALLVEVSEDYQRRGVAGILIRQAQLEHDSLHLLNFAGKAGESLYTKMGFKLEGEPDHFVWKREMQINAD